MSSFLLLALLTLCYPSTLTSVDTPPIPNDIAQQLTIVEDKQSAVVTDTATGQVRRNLLSETELTIETSGTASSGHFSPLWLTSNHYGLASVEPQSAYLRARLERDILADSARRWRIGYGFDFAVAAGHERTGIVQQAFVEGAWKRLRLTLGAKQQPVETQNAELASGALALGINGRPIPQVRLDIDWFPFPWTRGWWQWHLYGSYGWMTDGHWQQGWVNEGERYTRHALYHEKALYWQFGRSDIFPLTYEIGLRMATTFAGDCYNISTKRVHQGALHDEHYPANIKAYWYALTAQGADDTDGSNPNVAGNTLGSWIMQLRYHGQGWQARAYWERFFEDHSMLTVQYGIRDMLIGAEVTLPRNPYVNAAVLEFMSSTDQSGAVYHDETPNLPERIAGRDNYYNHNLYGGWQHYGFTLGNPLLTSPLYNAAFGHDHTLYFFNNRVKAWHIGLSGDPAAQWHWRALASFTRNWGLYEAPLADITRQNYFMAETTFSPSWGAHGTPRHPTALSGWRFSLALGLDYGQLLGNSFGAQLTISKRLTLKP